MEHEEERKITIKMIPNLMNMPKGKDCGQNMMSKHFRDFETYLSQRYGVERFPLGWLVRLNLPAITWSLVTAARMQSKGKKIYFFCLQEANHRILYLWSFTVTFLKMVTRSVAYVINFS